jgi:hypothetical protein
MTACKNNCVELDIEDFRVRLTPQAITDRILDVLTTFESGSAQRSIFQKVLHLRPDLPKAEMFRHAARDQPSSRLRAPMCASAL